MNVGNKNTPSTHHPRKRNVTTLMVGLKKRSHTQKSHPKVVNPRDIGGERKKKKKKKKKERNCRSSVVSTQRTFECNPVTLLLLLLVSCSTSQQHASVSQGWICSNKFTCCHVEIEVADQTFHLTQSQYTDTLTPGRPVPALTL